MKSLFPNYTLTHKIGSGGFAVVYKALERRGFVAIKLPTYLDETVDISILKKFKAEADLWKNLKHKNIVKFFEGHIRPVPHLVIGLVEGGNLKQLMSRYRLSIGDAINIMLRILEGMSYAHRMGIVHRDIKPSNILFTKNGVPKLSDWGIGKFMASASTTKSAGTKGTLAYSAPEQISPKKFGKVNWRADIYQLSVVFYEMLTGTNPFQEDDPATIVGNILYETPAPPSSINPKIPSDLDNIVMKALRKRKETRWRSADVVFEKLNELVER